jgi:hypothetical protein
MAVRTAPSKPARKVRAPRQIVQAVEHVAELKLQRRDGTGALYSAVVDLGRGTVRITQDTKPITFKGTAEVEEGINDLVDFFVGVRDYIANAPASVLVFDEDEDETEGPAPEATPAA